MRWLGIRTIRGQLTAGLILLQILFTVLFASLLLRAQLRDIRERDTRRIDYQSRMLAVETQQDLRTRDAKRLTQIAQVLETSPSVLGVRITDAQGEVLGLSDGESAKLSASEIAARDRGDTMRIFVNEAGERESVTRIYGGKGPGGKSPNSGSKELNGGGKGPNDQLLGFGFVTQDPAEEREQIRTLIRITVLFGLLGVLASVVASALLAREITRPLQAVMDATRRLIRDPETKEGFPLVVHEKNEAAELANAFNLMVVAMAEQRAGLSDTLALLDSMLAHAPIGFVFFDRKHRYVRVNQFMAEKTGVPVTRYLGRSVEEVFPESAAAELEARLDSVFESGLPVQDFEFHPGGEAEGDEAAEGRRSWLMNIYPVKTGQGSVRWVGAVVIDTTDSKRAEQMLRRTEKLAATGRLAASIAHEINNPLEAATNLIFLLENHSGLNETAREYARMAEHQLSRVSEITQQTLRFYRQSTRPVLTSLPEVFASMVTLYQGRVHALHVEVLTRYDRDASLVCLAGGIRQLFANLIGNALDAMPGGGRLYLRVRRSFHWRSGEPGLRVVVADTGSGMPEPVRRRIFEPFYTTKEATGTGLGLWVSLEIIQKHKGSVAVRSRCAAVAGKRSGTAFMVFLPNEGISPTTVDRESAEAAVSG